MIDFKNGSFIHLKETNSLNEEMVLKLFVDNEKIIGCYKGIRDYVIFTNKRIITINVQGVTGKKKDFCTLPYSKIQAFSIETAGTLDLDSELDLYFSGIGQIKFKFTSSSNIVEIGKTISNFIL